MNGLVFMIEEDALQKLSAYFESIKAHYGADGGEITGDIEADIADKFQAKSGGRQKVITAIDVEEIIKVMGTVSQIGEEESEESAAPGEAKDGQKKARRLYRDKDNAILGGVCSGLAAYFAIDPVIVRLVFIALTLMNGAGILVYIVFWLVVPEAKTSVQKLEMQGETINLKNIEEVVREKSELIKEQSKKAYVSLKEQKSTLAKIVSVPVILAEVLIKFAKGISGVILPVVRLLAGLFVIFFALIIFVFISFWAVVLLFKTGSPLLQSDFPISQIAHTKAYYTTVISAYFICLIPLVAALMSAASILRKKNVFNWTIATVLLALWIFNITIASIFGFDLASDAKVVREKYISENTVEESVSISGFNAISGGAYGYLKVEQADGYAVSIKGLKEDVASIRFSKEATTSDGIINLNITDIYNPKGFLPINKPVEIVVKMPEIKQLEASHFLSYDLSGFGTKPEIIPVRSDRMIKGNCVQGDGYEWCESAGRCIRPWEEICESDINFSESGTSVKNLPGLENDRLYIIYEEPGQPALRAELAFDEDSLCGDGKTKIVCMALSISDYGLANGRAIEVRGIESDGIVTVRELVLKPIK